jgi:predicted amidophosphoribosyltransferase
MKAAHWTQRTHLFRADEFICSECRSASDKPYRVCPACGSPMKKTKYDASWVDEAEGLSALLDDDW